MDLRDPLIRCAGCRRRRRCRGRTACPSARVPGAQAAASMVVDTTVGVLTQLVFVLTGVMLLVIHSTSTQRCWVAWVVSIGMGVFIVAVAAFVLFQHRNMFVMFAKLARGWCPRNGCPVSRVTPRRSTMRLWLYTVTVLLRATCCAL